MEQKERKGIRMRDSEIRKSGREGNRQKLKEKRVKQNKDRRQRNSEDKEKRKERKKEDWKIGKRLR